MNSKQDNNVVGFETIKAKQPEKEAPTEQPNTSQRVSTMYLNMVLDNIAREGEMVSRNIMDEMAQLGPESKQYFELSAAKEELDLGKWAAEIALCAIKEEIEKKHDDSMYQLCAGPKIYGVAISIIDRAIAGLPISALSGKDFEWEDASEQYSNMIGQEMWFTPDHRPGTSIKIESIDQNVRFPMVLRFNHSNEFAHRIDAVIYLDRDGELLNPFEIKQSPVRFINMPYYVHERIPLVWDTESERLVHCGARNKRESEIAESLIPSSIREVIMESMDQDLEYDISMLSQDEELTDDDGDIIIEPQGESTEE